MIGAHLGEAFNEAMRGDIMASQQNRQQQQADRQQEQMDIFKEQYQQTQDAKFKQEAYQTVLNAKKYGDFSGFKALAQAYPDKFGGGEGLRAANEGDFTDFMPDGTQGMGGQIRNRFLEGTGQELPEDPKEAMEVLSKSGFIPGQDGGQGTFVTAEQLGAGIGPGFREFERNDQMKEALFMKQMQGAQEKVSAESEFAELEDAGYDNLDSLNQKKYKVLSNKLGMTEANAKENLASGVYKEEIDRTKGGETIDPEMARNAKRDQVLSGLEYKGQVELTKGLKNYENMSRLNRELQTAKDEEIASGKVESMEANTTKYASNEDFGTMKAKEQKAVITKIMRDSKVGTFIADYLKDKSGAAVTEEEFLRTLKTLTGGDLDNINSTTLAAAFGTATREQGKAVESLLNVVPTQYAGTILEGREMLYGNSKGIPGRSAESYVKQGGDKSRTEVAAKVPAEQINQGLEAINEIAKQFGIDLGGLGSTTKEVSAAEVDPQAASKAVADKDVKAMGGDDTINYLEELGQDKAQEWINDNWANLSVDTKAALKAKYGGK